MKIFLDTNVVVDFITCREPFAGLATQIFHMADTHTGRLYVSDLTFVNVAYIIRKWVKPEHFYETLSELQSYLHIAAVGKEAVHAALSLRAKDFEDAVQYFSAKQAGADCIITRNKKDFYFSDIPVYAPEEFLCR